MYRNPAALAVGDMAVLSDVAEGIDSPAEIARIERMAGPSLTKHLRTLAARGLLVRGKHEADARRAVLTLTGAGRAALTAARSGSWLASSVRELTPDDAKTLAAAIPVLRLLGADAPSAASPVEAALL